VDDKIVPLGEAVLSVADFLPVLVNLAVANAKAAPTVLAEADRLILAPGETSLQPFVDFTGKG
jgi:C4-dicarboxylate transporter